MEIRDRMLKGEKWEDLVPNSVLELMQKINAVERMERISRGKLADE
jgi:nicotinamide mononucleotide adenylyltransferase